MADWRPIETAPKDGTRALYYQPGNPKASNRRARSAIIRTDSFNKLWPQAHHQFPESPYTHWMPLPEPPESCK